ncbi:intracellular sulfur oxidation DsrE/DsrF family protein [Bradyrhizobium diazoefficiens]
MISANGWSRRGLLAGTAILTAGGAAAREDRLADGVVILIDSNEPYVMGHAISYSANLAKHFADKGARLLIEVVANGKGIDVFRADKTPAGRAARDAAAVAAQSHLQHVRVVEGDRRSQGAGLDSVDIGREPCAVRDRPRRRSAIEGLGLYPCVRSLVRPARHCPGERC